MEPFRCVLRVRYGEIDGQKVVFNARWADYVDVVAGEYFCAVFAVTDGDGTIESHLVKQTIEWHAPAYFDDVLVATVRTKHIGRTSFSTHTAFVREGSDEVLVDVETVYVAIEKGTHQKRLLTEIERERLQTSGVGVSIDMAGNRGRKQQR